MNGRTLSDKIIEAHAIGSADGAYQQVRIDALLGHDATIALIIDEFERRGLSIWDPARVIFTNDHFSPPSSVERAEIARRFLCFARAHQVGHLLVDRGICHQLLVEHPLCRPGSLIVGADSHTIMGGALGAAATGMGSTDIAFALATGTTWLRRPASVRVHLRGALPGACSGRDVILHLLRELGEGGARYRAVEIHDHAGLDQDDRFAIANMVVEMGGKLGLFVPDEITRAYCLERDGRAPALVAPDADAAYERDIDVDLSALTPLVAEPWSPASVTPLAALARTPITHAFLGSCSSGRLSDLREAAAVVAGCQVHERVRFVVIPASVAVFQQALARGYVQALSEAGAVLVNPSCGPCGGIDKGVLGARDVCVSTSNRNFRGRMGHWESRTYLASARTVALAALRGYVGGET